MSDPLVTSSPTVQTPASYWWREIIQMTDLSRKILHTTTEAQRIYRANGLAAQIEALAAGEALPGTTMTKEHALALAQTMQAVSVFLATEVQPGRTIEDMLYAVWQPAVTSDPPV